MWSASDGGGPIKCWDPEKFKTNKDITTTAFVKGEVVTHMAKIHSDMSMPPSSPSIMLYSILLIFVLLSLYNALYPLSSSIVLILTSLGWYNEWNDKDLDDTKEEDDPRDEGIIHSNSFIHPLYLSYVEICRLVHFLFGI